MPALLNEHPFATRVCRGLVTGQVPVFMDGRSGLPISVAPVWTDIVAHPVDLPSSASTYQVFSSETSDNAAGTGAHTVFIWGLSATGEQVESVYQPPWQSELLTMNGVGFVSTANQYLSVIGAQVLNTGSTGFNDGDIDIRRISPIVNTIRIDAGRGKSRDSIMSVPGGWNAEVVSIKPFWTGANVAEWELRLQNSAGQQRTLLDGELTSASSGQTVELGGGICIGDETSIWFRARRSVGPVTDTMRIIAVVNMFVVDDTVIPADEPGFP